MKILLTAINAKYIHTNLAVLSLRAYAKEYRDNIHIAEYSINQHIDDILQDIYKQKPDIIAFSCYIWNINIIEELSTELKKVLSNAKIWFGGPEVSYGFHNVIKRNACLTGIIIGEGEETFKELAGYYIEENILLSDIKGIIYRDEHNITETKSRELIDLSSIPFPYEDISKYNQKIIYYETSRGCPFSCGYCLSSLNTGVRFRDINLIKQELMFFLNNKVKQVKFVDRTFNCNSRHAISIWEFIRDNDNGITNFHFEISGDLIREEELNLLATLREGLVQFEIGVQSTNAQTIKAINRIMNFSKLSTIVKKIYNNKNIHQHLDLIAGLPYEDYTSFKESFNQVYDLMPNQLQLGFLKVLKGSHMHEHSNDYGIVYKENPPYEVLYTKWLSYDEILKLKAIEGIVEIYHNTGQFTHSIKYLEKFYKEPFDLYEDIAGYYQQNDLHTLSHSRISRYDILLKYVQQGDINADTEAFKEILIYDLYLRENLKCRPPYAKDNMVYKEKYKEFFTNKEKTDIYLKGYTSYNSKQISRMTHIEYFSIDIEQTVKKGQTIKKDTFILFDYINRNQLNHEAKTTILEL